MRSTTRVSRSCSRFEQFLVDTHQLLLARLLVNARHDIEREIQDALKVARREVEQQADAAGRSLEVPDVAHGRRQFDVAHALAAHFRARHLDTAFVTDDALEAHALIFAAIAFPVLRRAEDALAEQAVFLRLERAVVDRLRLRDLAIAPTTNLLRAGKADTDCIKIIDFEHAASSYLCRGRCIAPAH